jgi:hypothetical protein
MPELVEDPFLTPIDPDPVSAPEKPATIPLQANFRIADASATDDDPFAPIAEAIPADRPTTLQQTEVH